MIQDYAELVTEVAHRTGLEIAPRAAQYVGLAEKALEKHLKTSGMESTATLTTDGDGEVALPSDFLTMRLVRTSQGDLRRCSLAEILDDTETGYAVRGSTLVSSEASTVHTAYYYRTIPSLAENSTNWLLTEAPEIYLDAVAAQAFKAAGQVEPYMALNAATMQSVADFNSQDRTARYSRTRISAGGYRP